MSARVSPLLLRAGYFNSTWKSQWYSDSNYTLLLFEDNIIKQYLENYHYYLKIPSSNYIYKRFQHNLSYIYNLIYFPYFKNYNDLFLFDFKYFRLSIYNINDFIVTDKNLSSSFFKLFILNKKSSNTLTQVQNNLINYFYFLKVIVKYQNLNTIILLLDNRNNNINITDFYLPFLKIKFIFNLINNKFYYLLLTKLKINKYSYFLKQKMKSSIFLKTINAIELSRTFIENKKMGAIKKSRYLNLLNTQHAFSNYFTNDILYDYDEYNSNFFFSFFKKNMIDLIKIYSNFFFNKKLRRYFYKKKKINFKIKKMYRRKFIKKKIKFLFFLKKYKLYSIFLKNINNIIHSNLDSIKTLIKSNFIINHSPFFLNLVNNAKLFDKMSAFNLNLQFFNITKFFFLFLLKQKLVFRNLVASINIKNKYLNKIKSIYYFFIMKYNFVKAKKIKFFKKKQHFFFNKQIRSHNLPILFQIYNGEHSVLLSYKLSQLVDKVKKIHNFYLFCTKYNNIVFNYTKNNKFFNNNYYFLPRFIESNLFFANQFKSNLNTKKSLLNTKMSYYNKLVNIGNSKQTNIFQLKKQKKYKFNLLRRNFNQPSFKLIKLFKHRIKNKMKLNTYSKNLISLKKKNKNYFDLIKNYNLFVLVKKTIFLYKKYNTLIKNLLYKIFNLKAKYLSLFKYNKNYNSYLLLKKKYIVLYNLNIKLYKFYVRKLRSIYSILIFEFNLLKSANLVKKNVFLNFRLKKKSRFFKLKLIQGRFFKTINKLFKFRNSYSFLNYKYKLQSFSKVPKSNLSNIINKMVLSSYKGNKLFFLFNKYYNSFFKKLNTKNIKFNNQSLNILSVLLNANIKNRLFNKFGYVTSYFFKAIYKNKLNPTNFLFLVKYIQLLNTTSIYNSYLESMFSIYTKILENTRSSLFYILKNKIIFFFKYKLLNALNLPKYKQRNFKFNEDQFSFILNKYNEISNNLVKSELLSFKKLKLSSLQLSLHNLLVPLLQNKTYKSISLNKILITHLLSGEKKINKRRQFFYLKKNDNFIFYNVKNKIKLNFLNLFTSLLNSKFNLITNLRKQGNFNSFLIKLRDQFYLNTKNGFAKANYLKYLNFINISLVFENISIYLNYLKNMFFFPSRKLYFLTKFNLINISDINYIDFIKFKLINNIKIKIKFYFNSIFYFNKLQFIFYKLISFTKLLNNNRYNSSLTKTNLKVDSLFFKASSKKITLSNSFKLMIFSLFTKKHHFFSYNKTNTYLVSNEVYYSINNSKLRTFFYKLYFYFLFQSKILKIRTSKETFLNSSINNLINSILKSNFKFFNYNLNGLNKLKLKEATTKDQFNFDLINSFWLKKTNFLFFFSIYKNNIFFFLNSLNSLKQKYISFFFFILNNIKLNFKLKYNFMLKNYIKLNYNLESISNKNNLLSSYFSFSFIFFYKLKSILLFASSISNYINSFLVFNNSKFNLAVFHNLCHKYKSSFNKYNIIKNIMNSNNLKTKRAFKLNLVVSGKEKKNNNLIMNYKSICSIYLRKLNKIKFRLMKVSRSFTSSIPNTYGHFYNKIFRNIKYSINSKIYTLNSVINNPYNIKNNFKLKIKKQNLNSLLLLKLKRLKQNDFSYYVHNFLISSFSRFNQYNLIKSINSNLYLGNFRSLNKADFNSIYRFLQLRLKIIYFYLNYKKGIPNFNYKNVQFNKPNFQNFSFKTKSTKQKLKFKKKNSIDLRHILNLSKKIKLSNNINYDHLNKLIKIISNANRDLISASSIQSLNKQAVISFLAKYFNFFVSDKSMNSKVSILLNYYLFKFIYNKNKVFKFNIYSLLSSLSKSNTFRYLFKRNLTQVSVNKLINFKFNLFFKKKTAADLLSFFFFKSFKQPFHSVLKYRFNSSNNLNSIINSFKNEIQAISYTYNNKTINFKSNYRLAPSFYKILKQRRFFKFNKINSFYFNYNNNIYKINRKSPFFSYVLKQDIHSFIYNRLRTQFVNFQSLKGTNLNYLFFKLNNLIKLFKQQEQINLFLNKLILILKPRKKTIALIKLIYFYKYTTKGRLSNLKGQLFYYLSKLVFYDSSFNKLNIKFKRNKKKLTRLNIFFYKKRKYLSYLKFNFKKKSMKKKNLFDIKKKNSFFYHSNVALFQFKSAFLNKLESIRDNLVQSGNLKRKRKKISFLSQFSKFPKQRKYFFLYKNKKKLFRFRLNKYKYSNIHLFKLLYNKYRNIFNLHHKYLKYNKFNLKRLNSYYRSFLILKLKDINFNRYIRLVYIKLRYLKLFNLWKNHITKKKYFKLVSALIRKFKHQFNIYVSFTTNKMKKKKIKIKPFKGVFGKKRKIEPTKFNFFLDKLLKTKQKSINYKVAPKKKNIKFKFKNVKSFYYFKFKKLAKLKLKNNYFNLRSLFKYKLDYNNYLNYMKLKMNSFFLNRTNWLALVNSLNKRNKYNISNNVSIFSQGKLLDFNSLVNYIRFFIKSFVVFIFQNDKINLNQKIKLIQFLKILYFRYIKSYKLKMIKLNFTNHLTHYSYQFNELINLIHKCNKMKNHFFNLISSNKLFILNGAKTVLPQFNAVCNYSLFYLYLNNKIIVLNNSDKFKYISRFYNKKHLFSQIKYKIIKKKNNKFIHSLFNSINSKPVYFKNKYKYLKLNNKYNKNYIHYLMNNLNTVYLKKKEIINNHLSLNNLSSYLLKLKNVLKLNNNNSFRLNSYYSFLKNKILSKFKFNYYFNHFMYQSKVYYSKIKTKYKFQLIYNKVFFQLFKLVNQVSKLTSLFFNANKIEVLKNKKSKLISFYLYLINSKSKTSYSNINKFFILINKLMSNNLKKKKRNIFFNKRAVKLLNYQNQFISIRYNNNQFLFNFKLIQFIFFFIKLQTNSNLIINNLFDKLYLVSHFGTAEKQFVVYYYYYYYFYIYYYLIFNFNIIQSYLSYIILNKYKNNINFKSTDLLNKNKYYLFFKLINQVFSTFSRFYTIRSYKVMPFLEMNINNNPNRVFKNAVEMLENKKLSFIQLNYSVEHDLNKFSISENNNIFYFNNIYFYNYDYNFIFTLESKLLCEYIVYAFLSKKQYFEINDEIKEAMNDLYRFKIIIKRAYDYLLFKLLNYYIDFVIDFFYFNLENMGYKTTLEYNSFVLLFNNKLKIIIQLLKSLFIIISMMNNFNIKGVRIKYTGRQSRKVRADTKLFSRNKMALNCLVNRIDFYYKPVYIKYGAVGIKVFIYKENEYVTPLYHLLFKGIITRVNTITKLINNFKS